MNKILPQSLYMHLVKVLYLNLEWERPREVVTKVKKALGWNTVHAF